MLKEIVNSGESNLSRNQRDKLDKISNNILRQAWDNKETFNKIYAETLSILKGKENKIQPKLCTRKRKGNDSDTENEGISEGNDENVNSKGEYPRRTPSKTARVKKK